jgi:HlyD family secretion protein
VLVKINPQQMLAERDEARAQIAAAQARMAQSHATLIRNQQELARVEGLQAKKLATNQELESAQAQVKIAEADQDAARYQVEQMQASYRRVVESVNKTTIVSPISGVVTKLNSKLGEKVVGAIQMTGTEIMTVADLSVIEAVVNVSENDVVQVAIGDTAEVEVDAIPGQKFRAVVSRIANSPKQAGVGTQEQITNFEVRLRFLEPDTRFRPGMTATAMIQTEKKNNILAVPIQSVTTREKIDSSKLKNTAAEGEAHNVNLEKAQKEALPEPVVFVRTGNVVHTRKVATGIRDDQYIEITSGLKAGEVVVSGSYRAITKDLNDSSRVMDAPKVKDVPKEKP